MQHRYKAGKGNLKELIIGSEEQTSELIMPGRLLTHISYPRSID